MKAKGKVDIVLKTYGVIAIMSVALIVPYVLLLTHVLDETQMFSDKDVLSVLAAMGESGLVASFTAFLIEMARRKHKRDESTRFRESYTKNIAREARRLLQRILWLARKLDDNTFPWGNDIRYFMEVHGCALDYGAEKTPFYSREDAKKAFEKLKHDFSVEGQTAMALPRQQRILKLFQIIAEFAESLLVSIVRLQRDQVMLHALNVVDFDEISNVIARVSWFSMVVAPTGKMRNFNFSIDSLWSLLDLIEPDCDKDIPIHPEIDPVIF